MTAYRSFSPVLQSGSASRDVQEYGRLHQHVGLLEDEQRVRMFLAAIHRTSPGGTVVDVGAGTGVWGLSALLHGYDRAVLIEPSAKMCAYARHAAELNDLVDRVEIIQASLEDVSPLLLPERVDLIVTETISSLIFGFGCWDAFPTLAGRLSQSGHAIPSRGALYAVLVERDFATRGPKSGSGLSLLHDIGLRLDVSESAFRSSGNVYAKVDFLWYLNQHQIRDLPPVARFDLAGSAMDISGADLIASKTSTYVGLVFFFDIEMSSADPSCRMSSLDPLLTSWYPYYVPFSVPVALERGDRLPVQISLHPIDNPYKYAFRIESNGLPLSAMMYW